MENDRELTEFATQLQQEIISIADTESIESLGLMSLRSI